MKAPTASSEIAVWFVVIVVVFLLLLLADRHSKL